MEATFQERLDRIRERMARACARAARSPDTVQLIAVSKTMPAECVCAAASLGLTLFGENKVQEAAAKRPACPGHLTWHMIGHLQRNKATAAVQLFDMIHSVDSPRLLEALDRAAREEGKRMPMLVEVNVSGESSKFGACPEEVPALLENALNREHVQVRGLMTMPPFTEDPEKARPYFRRLREVRDECRARLDMDLPELSMGMTNDFEIAIEEGATFIRVGTALFGARARAQPPWGAEEEGTHA